VTAATHTTDRRSFLHLAILGIGAAIAAQALSIPDFGEVITGDHAVERHGTTAETVRKFFATSVSVSPIVWMQPPCDDGRYRIMVKMAARLWAVWVLVRIAPNTYHEITAFATDSQAYVQAVRDDCGNGGFFQHA
jgi:hypothetical protein